LARSPGQPSGETAGAAEAGCERAIAWGGVITKEFIIAKIFRAHSTNFFRQEKSLRDHGAELGYVI
jgi:hypothetical protein